MSLCQCLNAPLFEGTRSVLTMQAPALSRIDSNLIIGHGHDTFFQEALKSFVKRIALFHRLTECSNVIVL